MHGFTAIQVMFSMNPDSANRAGQKPLIDYDFAKPNDTFFTHAEAVPKIADSLGLLVNIAPFWIGCCREGYGVGHKHEVYANSAPTKPGKWGSTSAIGLVSSKMLSGLPGRQCPAQHQGRDCGNGREAVSGRTAATHRVSCQPAPQQY